MKHTIVLILLGVSAMATNAKANFEIRAAFLKECPLTGATQRKLSAAPTAAVPEALGATILSVLAVKLADKAAQTLVTTVTPRDVTYDRTFLHPGMSKDKDAKLSLPPASCIVIAGGDFSVESESSDFPLPDSAVAYAEGKQRVRDLFKAKRIDFYFESNFATFGDAAIAFEPRAIFLRDFLSSNFFAGSTRSLLLQLQFMAPGTTEAEVLKFEFESKVESVPYFATFKPSSGGFLTGGLAQPGRWYQLSESAAKPLSLKVSVTERPRPNQILAAISETLSDTAVTNQIKDSIKQAIDGNARSTAENAAVAAAKTALEKYKTARAAVVTNCSSAPTDEVGKRNCDILRREAVTAKAAAEAALREAGLASELDAVP